MECATIHPSEVCQKRKFGRFWHKKHTAEERERWDREKKERSRRYWCFWRSDLIRAAGTVFGRAASEVPSGVNWQKKGAFLPEGKDFLL